MKCDLSTHFLCFFPLWPGFKRRLYSHVISLMGLAFNGGVLLEIDHQWISDKSVPLHLPLLYPFHPQVHPISITSLTLLHFVPVPLVSSFIPAFPVSLISISMSPRSSHLLHIVFLPCSCLSLFHTRILFLVLDQVKPTLQHRVS